MDKAVNTPARQWNILAKPELFKKNVKRYNISNKAGKLLKKLLGKINILWFRKYKLGMDKWYRKASVEITGPRDAKKDKIKAKIKIAVHGEKLNFLQIITDFISLIICLISLKQKTLLTINNPNTNSEYNPPRIPKKKMQ